MFIFFSTKSSKISVKRIRQFDDKVLVEFDRAVPLSLFESPFYYRERLIPVVPAMRPNLNVGKYKDRTLKASALFLNDEDKKFLSQRFASGDVYKEFKEGSETMKKKAEAIYAKISQEEKKIREKLGLTNLEMALSQASLDESKAASATSASITLSLMKAAVSRAKVEIKSRDDTITELDNKIFELQSKLPSAESGGGGVKINCCSD